MIQELEPDQCYYLDLIDDELAITAMQVLRFDNERTRSCYSVSYDDDGLVSRRAGSMASAYGGVREDNQLGEGVTLKQTVLKSEFKLAILGDSKVGKSALVQRLINKDVFIQSYHETLIDNYKQQMFMLDEEGVRNREITLHIKDVGFRFINEDALLEQDAFIICFDV